jgi:hypothetical protein
MFKTFYIKPNERGILYHRSDFKAILQPGTHRYLGWNWRVETYDLNQPEAIVATAWDRIAAAFDDRPDGIRSSCLS